MPEDAPVRAAAIWRHKQPLEPKNPARVPVPIKYAHGLATAVSDPTVWMKEDITQASSQPSTAIIAPQPSDDDEYDDDDEDYDDEDDDYDDDDESSISTAAPPPK